jgi:hypothetical protein
LSANRCGWECSRFEDVSQGFLRLLRLHLGKWFNEKVSALMVSADVLTSAAGFDKAATSVESCEAGPGRPRCRTRTALTLRRRLGHPLRGMSCPHASFTVGHKGRISASQNHSKSRERNSRDQ